MQAAEESDFVIPVGWQFYEISEVAGEYPDTKFIWVDNPAENIENLPNVLCITYAQNEGAFLAGYIAVSYTHLDVYKRQDMDDYPEAAFFNVGTIDDVVRKAETLEV